MKLFSTVAVVATALMLMPSFGHAHITPAQCGPIENVQSQINAESRWGETRSQILGMMNPGRGYVELWASEGTSTTSRGTPVENSWTLLLVNPEIGMACIMASGHSNGFSEEELRDMLRPSESTDDGREDL